MKKIPQSALEEIVEETQFFSFREAIAAAWAYGWTSGATDMLAPPTGAQLVGRECWVRTNPAHEYRRRMIVSYECGVYVTADGFSFGDAKIYKDGVSP